MSNVTIQQDKRVPLLIRDDGMLAPNVPSLLSNPRFRPYHGKPDATEAELQEYLDGFSGNVSAAAVAAEAGAFDIDTASKDELIEFALDEFGQRLDGRKSIENIRAEVTALAEKAKG